MIRITVTTDEGVLLDSTEMTGDEFRAAQASTTGSWAVLSNLSIGDAQ